MDEVANTFLPNVHSTCSGGKIYWHCFMNFLTYYFYPYAFEFIVVLGTYSCHSSSRRNLACGTWLVYPRNIPHDDLFSHRMSISQSTNSWQDYGLSSCNNEK